MTIIFDKRLQQQRQTTTCRLSECSELIYSADVGCGRISRDVEGPDPDVRDVSRVRVLPGAG